MQGSKFILILISAIMLLGSIYGTLSTTPPDVIPHETLALMMKPGETHIYPKIYINGDKISRGDDGTININYPGNHSISVVNDQNELCGVAYIDKTAKEIDIDCTNQTMKVLYYATNGVYTNRTYSLRPCKFIS